MSELNHVLESITIIDGEGNISFKNYSPNLLAELNNRIIFKNPQRRDSLHLVNFNDNRWIIRDETKIVSFASLTQELEYELKAIFLSSVFIGRKRNFKTNIGKCKKSLRRCRCDTTDPADPRRYRRRTLKLYGTSMSEPLYRRT